MVIAVIPVGVMQVALHEIVGVVAVGNLVMAAVTAMLMGAGVGAAVMLGRARRGVLRVNLKRMLIDVILMRVVQVTVVQVVDVIIVTDRGVPAVRAMTMVVTRVGGMLRNAHKSHPTKPSGGAQLVEDEKHSRLQHVTQGRLSQ